MDQKETDLERIARTSKQYIKGFLGGLSEEN